MAVQHQMLLGSGGGGYTAKSIILDIADPHSLDANFIAIFQVDFWYQESKIAQIYPDDYVSYHTTEESQYNSEYAFDTRLSKIGTPSYKSWISRNANINQRLICVVDSPITFDEIRINNFHDAGGEVESGAKNVKITITPDSITNTTYNAAVSNGTVIFNGQFDQHVESNVEDEQILTLE